MNPSGEVQVLLFEANVNTTLREAEDNLTQIVEVAGQSVHREHSVSLANVARELFELGRVETIIYYNIVFVLYVQVSLKWLRVPRLRCEGDAPVAAKDSYRAPQGKKTENTVPERPACWLVRR